MIKELNRRMLSHILKYYYSICLTRSFSRNNLIYRLLSNISLEYLKFNNYYGSGGEYSLAININNNVLRIYRDKESSIFNKRNKIMVRYGESGSPFGYNHNIEDINSKISTDDFIRFLQSEYDNIRSSVDKETKLNNDHSNLVEDNTERFKDYCNVSINSLMVTIKTKYSNLSELIEDIKIFQEVLPNYIASFYTKSLYVNIITKMVEIDNDDMITVKLSPSIIKLTSFEVLGEIAYNRRGRCIAPIRVVESNKDSYKVNLYQIKE